MRALRASAILVSVLGFAALLAACSPIGATYSALDREATATDELPVAVASGSDDIAAETARLVGEHDASRLWLARAVQPGMICLIVYPNDVDWVAGCGTEKGPIGVAGPSGDYVLMPDNAPAPEDSSKLTDNVYLLSG